MGTGIFEGLSKIRDLAKKGDGEALVAYGRRRAEQGAGKKQAARIAAVDFAAYEKAFRKGLRKAAKEAVARDANALYFEYDLDNEWQSNFFICGPYTPEAEGDDEWACDWMEDVPGPDFPELTRIYEENGFDQTPAAVGSTLFLVARTVAAIGRIVRKEALQSLTFCIAFHDQSPILRLQEVAPRSKSPRWKSKHGE